MIKRKRLNFLWNSTHHFYLISIPNTELKMENNSFLRVDKLLNRTQFVSAQNPTEWKKSREKTERDEYVSHSQSILYYYCDYYYFSNCYYCYCVWSMSVASSFYFLFCD